MGLQSRPYTAWQLLKLYWQSNERVFAYGMLATTLAMTLSLIGIDVVFNQWYNLFYNALQEYDKHGVLDLLVVFCFIAGVYIILSVYRYYVQAYLGLRWRKWLTEQYINRWLEKRSYYYLENFNEATDNPDQRIQEDILALVTISLELLIGLVSALVTIIAFIFILWKLSGVISISLGHFGHLHIPGYLVWVAMIYSIAGTYLTFKIGYPLVSLNFEQQKREADFRFAAVDLRSHAEHVALYRGESHENFVLKRLLNRFLENWYVIILRQKLLLWFTAGYNQISVLVPLVVAIPNYFNKVFKLGGLMQSLQAFGHIQDSLSFIVNAYTRIAEWQAVVRRLLTFINHMYDVEEHAAKHNQIIFSFTSENKIILKEVSVFTPDEKALLTHINYEFIHGQNYLIKGPSGVGKSTLVRIIAGIWPYGQGEIVLPKNRKLMYLPQKPYMPIGTLRDALLFPDQYQSYSDEKIIAFLNAVHLSQLVSELNYVTMWSEHLSPGELQRVAFIRVFLQEPEWVFLDETTSALDMTNETFMYHLLKTTLPQTTIISVGHRPSLEPLHDHILDLMAFSTREQQLIS